MKHQKAMKRSAIAAFLFAVLCLISVQVAFADITTAYNEHCQRYDCSGDYVGSGDFKPGNGMKTKIERIRHNLRKEFRFKDDATESWDIKLVGDCEDFALTLRHRLRDRFPEYSAAFKIATAYTENGIYHAVLTVGDFVCDVRYRNCFSKDNVNYTWDYIQVGSAWEVME